MGGKARIVEIARSICALRLRPTFWEAFYWRKSSAQGWRVQKKFMKSTPVHESALQGWVFSTLRYEKEQGSILSIKIWILRNFLTKIWTFWTHQFFQKIWEIYRQNILLQLAGQISENFPQNILIRTQFENLWKFSGM